MSYAGLCAFAATFVFPANRTKAYFLIRNDRCITIDELGSQFSVSRSSAQNIVESIGYSKIYVCWVSRQQSDDHKAKRVNC